MSDSNQQPDSPRTVAVNLQWHVEDIEVPLELSMPADPVEPQAVLPALQTLVNEVVAVSVKLLESRNKTVSCKAGCGACCRQIVPISDIEAHAIAEVIERMPDERRAHVMARFADAEQRLAAIKPLDQMIEEINGANRYEFAVEYFKYGVACPFLEDESCSIYPDRPLICREYLVHTPVENCSKVGEGGIGVVPISRASNALFRMSTIHDKPRETRVPLSLVPYWVARHPKNFKLTNGSDWIMRFVFSMEQADIEEEEAWQRAKKARTEQDALPAGSMVAPSS
ncbi:MAG TPA: YkgJ family cysteine cluster protein [Vineibacter sp.]|nr:YkgJ family cysteine cluster protein [Vineibacter sp.]